jgi:hypothetical protein
MREGVNEQRGGLVDCVRVTGSQRIELKSRLLRIGMIKYVHNASPSQDRERRSGAAAIIGESSRR